MARNFIDLNDLHDMFTVAGIEHRYTYGDLVITVVSGSHIWTVSENHVIYWGDSIDVCKSRCYEFTWTSDAYDYLVDDYSKSL